MSSGVHPDKMLRVLYLSYSGTTDRAGPGKVDRPLYHMLSARPPGLGPPRCGVSLVQVGK